MGYEGDDIDRLFPLGPTERCGRRIADNGGDRLLDNTRARTPIDTNPYRHRPSRRRGSLRRSWKRVPGVRVTVRRGGRAWETSIFTDDPIWEFVELPTAPHEIRAKPGSVLRFRSRTGWTDRDGVFHPPGSWVAATVVRHPGTKGVFMLRRGAHATELEDDYAIAPLRGWKHEMERA